MSQNNSSKLSIGNSCGFEFGRQIQVYPTEFLYPELTLNSEEIKHEAQTSTQHPVFAPLLEQWESFTQALTTQAVRQCTIKTADDRLGVVWAEKVLEDSGKADDLEDVILSSLKRHVHALELITQNLTQASTGEDNDNYGTLFGF